MDFQYDRTDETEYLPLEQCAGGGELAYEVERHEDTGLFRFDDTDQLSLMGPPA